MKTTIQRACDGFRKAFEGDASASTIKRRFVRILEVGTRSDRKSHRVHNSTFGTKPGSGRRIIDNARRTKATKFIKVQS